MIKNCSNCVRNHVCEYKTKYVCEQWCQGSDRPMIYCASALKGNLDQDILLVPKREHKKFIAEYYQANVDAAARYSKEAMESNVIPLTPHLYFTTFLNDLNPEERKLGMDVGISWLLKSEALWVFGFISRGMQAEIDKALAVGIPVYIIDTKERVVLNEPAHIIDAGAGVQLYE